MKKIGLMVIGFFVLSGLLFAGIRKSDLIGVDRNELKVGLIDSVLVESGSFNMGPDDEYRVTLSKDYYMGIYQVTQKQYYEVMNTKPSHHTPSSGWEDRPVEFVSWYEAVEFCNVKCNTKMYKSTNINSSKQHLYDVSL